MPERNFRPDDAPDHTRPIRYTAGQHPVSWDQARERPIEDPGPPPVQRVQPDRSWVPWLIIVAALVLVLAGMGVVLRASNKLPASVPVLGRDPGVDLCVAVAGGGSPTGSETPGEMTEESYREARDVAGTIRNESLRSGTVKIIDLAWQDRNGKLGLEALGSVGVAYSEMTTGCADLGVSLPALAELATTN